MLPEGGAVALRHTAAADRRRATGGWRALYMDNCSIPWRSLNAREEFCRRAQSVVYYDQGALKVTMRQQESVLRVLIAFGSRMTFTEFFTDSRYCLLVTTPP